jgi:hypothetical protein
MTSLPPKKWMVHSTSGRLFDRPELGSTEDWRNGGFSSAIYGVLMGSITPNHHWLIVHHFHHFPIFMGSIKPHLNSPSKPSMDWFKGNSYPETIDFPMKYGAFL